MRAVWKSCSQVCPYFLIYQIVESASFVVVFLKLNIFSHISNFIICDILILLSIYADNNIVVNLENGFVGEEHFVDINIDGMINLGRSETSKCLNWLWIVMKVRCVKA